MFELLEKTNERVKLDRPFLIREKMQVIMIDSEKASPTMGRSRKVSMDSIREQKRSPVSITRDVSADAKKEKMQSNFDLL